MQSFLGIENFQSIFQKMTLMITTFDFPKPNSMTVSDAAKWYRTMIPLIPKIKIDEAYGDSEREIKLTEFKAHWMMKSRLRLAAALALYDQELVNEFFYSFSLPSANEFLGSAFSVTQDEKAFEWTLYQLLHVSEFEKRLFPGAIEESIGMECHTQDGIYVMTEEGWKKKE